MKPERPPAANAGTCIHYTGVLTAAMHCVPTCRAGVVYRELAGGEEPGWVGRLPCSRWSKGSQQQATCEHRQMPTDQQVEAWRAWRDEHTRLSLQAVRLAKAAAKQSQRAVGEVQCPACGGVLRWAVSRTNGHMHGRCDTGECIAWME